MEIDRIANLSDGFGNFYCMETKFPARIHILLARETSLGVVIRRGPSKRVCTLLWDRATDEFQIGQWLRGRIYERRCDLSPDGRYFIYFAMNGHWDGEAKGSWTGLSRAPYLKAFALFAKGDCWNGGGLFTGKDRYWLNGAHATIRDSREVRRDSNFIPATWFGNECTGIYYERLLRDGWSLVGQENLGEWKNRSIFEKHLSNEWVLRKIAHEEIGAPPGKGCYWDEHVLIGPQGTTACPTWEWAEVDGDRLVWATGGKLLGGRLDESGLTGEIELYDFNGMEFARIHAPY